MDRFIAKDAKLDNYDLTKVNLRDSYISNCSLKGTKLGDCTNASFFKCDLTNADFSKAILTDATFDDCILTNIKLTDSLTAFQRNIGKAILDVTGFMPTHNHTFCAYMMESKFDSAPKEYSKNILESINDVKTRKDLCWEDFGKLWEMKWGTQTAFKSAFLIWLADVFKADPRVWKLYTLTFKGRYGYENHEDIWQE
jgi:uncharacterized protein YjbI with pentapeptide repeats